jgi:hypothetical protein
LDTNVHEVEMSIAEAKKLVDRRDAVKRLSKNRDFRKIIDDGYFKDEAARLTSITADPNLKEQREDIFVALQGISTFKQYLQTIITMGNMAEAEIMDNEEILDELRGEEIH